LPYRQVGYWAAWREVIHHGQKLAKLAREHAAQPTVPYQEAA
jgi:uncharacterized protein YbcC (UPF0753/DUF2309 family)